MGREVSEQAQQSFNANHILAQSLLSGVKDLPQSSVDFEPLDQVNMMTRDMNFPHATVDDGTTREVTPQKTTNDKGVIPEQLDTSKPQPAHAVLQHLQKVAAHFENYANKLLNAVTPQDQKEGANGADNTTQHKCPFVRVANAVGFNVGQSDTSKLGIGSNNANSPESLRAQSAEAGGAPANAVEAAKNGAGPSGACPVA